MDEEIKLPEEQCLAEDALNERMMNLEEQERFIEEAQPFIDMMMVYQCAIREIETKLENLNAEFSMHYKRNPFESIKTRVKTPRSIIEKLKRKGLAVTRENIEEHLYDIAGIRVICSFPEDIYTFATLLANQDDVLVIEKKDYIKDPKPSGYRSLHLIVEVPVFLSREKKPVKVEVQFRTIAMDFWASLEHKLRYKKNITNTAEIQERLRFCADTIMSMDLEMQDIRNLIEKKEKRNSLSENGEGIIR